MKSCFFGKNKKPKAAQHKEDSVFKNCFFGKNKEQGGAILLALFTVSFVIFLATEISKQSIVEYFTSASAVKKVQAHHAAQACLRLNLLRIKGYQQASRALAKTLPDPSMLDIIWNLPLTWPLTIPKEISSFDKSSINKTLESSLLKQQFISFITSEGGRIDINDLGSPSESLRNHTKDQLLLRFQDRITNKDDAFSTRYANFNFEELVNNIADWVDEDQVSWNGGSEESYYTDLRNQFIPPNRPFKTMEELHMISGMEDRIYRFLSRQITLYGVKGININQAKRQVLLNLFTPYGVEIANQIIDDLLKRRADPSLGGPFKNEEDFIGFLENYIEVEEFTDKENRFPLFFGSESNFHISCTGVSGKMIREIQAIVYDSDSVRDRLQKALINDAKKQDPKCKELTGNEYYQCLCKESKSDTEKNKCIRDNKKLEQDLKEDTLAPLPPGPPTIIFQDVK